MINNFLITNIYESRKKQSKLSSQMLYGDKFKILKKYRHHYKIKTEYDNYVGYVKIKKFQNHIRNQTHKVNVLKTDLFSKPNLRFKTKKKISFGSIVGVENKKGLFSKFDNYWIKSSKLTPKNYSGKVFNKIKIFKNVKYLWGGMSYKGIDCSALIQIFFKYNNIFCPRDSGDQFKYFKSKKRSKGYSLIFWKGHVALGISKNKLIHAYGPRKKVVIMEKAKTIKIIHKTAKLKVLNNIK